MSVNLDTSSGLDFEIQQLFYINYGVNLEFENCEETTPNDPDGVAFVSRTASNNGVSGYVKRIDGVTPQSAGTISVAGGGSVLSTYVQPREYYSGRDLFVLTPKMNMSIESKLFIVTLIQANKYKYSYGRQANTTLPNISLKLPVDTNGNPDWKYMDEYIKSIHYKPIKTNNRPSCCNINTNEWMYFKVGKLFRMEATKGGVTNELIEGGDVPYIGAKRDTNGFMMMCQKDGFEDWVSSGNCIIFIQIGEGSAGYVNYMESDFIGMSGKTSCGYIDGVLNKYVGLFLVTILCKERPKYSFGRSWTGDRLLKTEIKLPIKHNEDGSIFIDDTHKFSENGYVPDWKFMEDYIKSLPYGDRI